jgi:DeoR/GlpR family transcriptional regulator of sugar metabolism
MSGSGKSTSGIPPRRPGRPSGSTGRGGTLQAVSEAVLKAGSRRVADLALDLGLSEVTVRKSLDELERQGVLRRFHGEARAYDGDAIPFRMGLRYDEKRRIAELAAGFVAGGDTILIEAGSAAAFLAERLKEMKDLTVLTPNLFIARVFRGSRVRVVVLGGAYQEESESLVGSLAVRAVAELGFSKAFLGVTGFTPGTGFTLNDFARAEVSRAILARGAENYILTDSSKFGASHAAVICSDLSQLRAVVTDPGIPADDRRLLEGLGVSVVV